MSKIVNISDGKQLNKKIIKKQSLPSKLFDSKEWKKINEIVEQEIEDYRLIMKNIGY